MIDQIKKDIKTLQKELVPEKDPTKQHYQVGDIVWINWSGEPKEGIIDEIQDFNKDSETGAYIFYWVIPLNRPKLKWYIYVTKFWVWQCFLRYFNFKSPKFDFCFGPGHAVLAGRDEDIFDSKNEAWCELLIQTILTDLDEVEDYYDNRD